MSIQVTTPARSGFPLTDMQLLTDGSNLECRGNQPVTESIWKPFQHVDELTLLGGSAGQMVTGR